MTRLEALDFYRGVEAVGDIRALLAGDLFYLLLAGMGRVDMNHDFLYARCREVQACPDGYLDLWAREHYKSTIITVGATIQDILNDPEVTVGIFSHTRPIAKAFLRQIKREFEGNKLLQEMFPHIRPPEGKDYRMWSEDGGLIVERNGNPKEATVEAWGLVDGQPTGKHFSLLIYDDVVTRESVTTPEQIKKTTEAWELSLNLGAHGGRRRMIGTRYHHFDTWQAILERGAARPRIYTATVDGTAEGAPVFLAPEALAEKRRDQGPYTFSAQMLQNPTADNAQGFDMAWFRTLPGAADPRGMNVYILVDPAGAKKKDSDYTAMWVVGLNHDGCYYVLDGVHDRLNLTERARALFALHRKHRPLAVGYEHYGIQADIEHLRYVMDQENYRFEIRALAGAMPKNDRIRRLVPVFEQGRMYFPHQIIKKRQDNTAHDLVDVFKRLEYQPFPVAEHDDMLDCLSRILDPDLQAAFPRDNVSAWKGASSFAQTDFDVFAW